MRAAPCALLGFALLACGGAREPANLVLVVVDTLRVDHLGVYGSSRDTSPVIDAFAKSGVRFDRAYATAPWTQPSIASILTGLPPETHGADLLLRSLPDSAYTLAERLRDAGYETGAVVSHYLIGPRFGFQQGFDTFVHGTALGPGRFSTPGVSARATELLARYAVEKRPFFLFLHYFDPHYSYERHEGVGFAARGGAGRLTGRESVEALRDLDPPPDAGERAFVRDLYDEEVRFTDTGIGTVLRTLSRLALDEKTVVVLVGDHGEEFWDRGWLGHTRTLHEELVRVPLVIRAPGVAPGVVSQPVSLVDLLPTLLDLLQVRVPERHLAARSFAPRMHAGGEAGGSPGPVYLSTAYRLEAGSGSEGAVADRPGLTGREVLRKRAVVDGGFKLVEDRSSGAVSLYDLNRDPQERHDLLPTSDPELTAVRDRLLRELVDSYRRYEAARLAGAVEAPEPSPEEARMLHELGYVAE